MGDSYHMSDYRDGTPGRVPCPRCGTLLAEEATNCFDCGVHFRKGTAYDFSMRGRDEGDGRLIRWITIIAAILLLAAAATVVLVVCV